MNNEQIVGTPEEINMVREAAPRLLERFPGCELLINSTVDIFKQYPRREASPEELEAIQKLSEQKP